MSNLTEREILSIKALATVFDDFIELKKDLDIPNDIRLKMDAHMDKSMALVHNAMKLYSPQVRKDITKGVSESRINKRHFDLIDEESGKIIVL